MASVRQDCDRLEGTVEIANGEVRLQFGDSQLTFSEAGAHPFSISQVAS